MTTRGIRNNNPMNIIKSSNKWEGKTVFEPLDSKFEQFTAAEYGIRAGVKLLLTYSTHYRLDTVRLLISRFAPAEEIGNPTDNYIDYVANYMNVDPDKELDVDDYKTMKSLVEGIIRFENRGVMPYSENTLRNALKMAGVADTPNKVASQEPVIKATGGAAAIGAVGLGAQLISVLAPLEGLLNGLVTSLPWVAAAFVIGIVAYIGYNHYKQVKSGAI